jgi:hypothetical protein
MPRFQQENISKVNFGQERQRRFGFRPSPLSATDWLKRLDKSRLQIVPTAKVTEIINMILSWKEAHPKGKVTIFTQWNHFAIMLGVLLQNEKIKFVYLTVSRVRTALAYVLR